MTGTVRALHYFNVRLEKRQARLHPVVDIRLPAQPGQAKEGVQVQRCGKMPIRLLFMRRNVDTILTAQLAAYNKAGVLGGFLK
jgi:hypothetical protein